MNISKKLTLADLAKLANVSTATVSRALNNNPLIKQQTRERINALAKEHNFSLNAAASRLRTQKTNVVAVILNIIDETEQSITDPFLLKVVGDLNKALNQAGFELLLSNSAMARDDWARYFIDGRRADGIIVVGQAKNDAKVRQTAARHVPLVVWGDPHSSAGYVIVGSNNQLGGFTATHHLLNSGCQKVLFLGDPEHAEMSERYRGYRQAIAEAKLEYDETLTLSIDITSTAAYEAISAHIISRGLTFDGIFACSDMVALGAMKALKERYINIPNEVAIIGFDDIALAELMHPALSTIKQDTAAAAEHIVAQLLAQLNGDAAESVMMDVKLIPRMSTRQPPTEYR
ncbi:LacI family DNA-binding transcriptional regulator [Alteromonas oceanisediminis]|uniref:LacI family DNA-binding transcriptional regulator n=1 Tax=Alteromonas oceanisediminis TaxID=2836180 RepID=UPI001BD9E164|nr:LacI family DNA-binding transcriptional regulator [Alteromonas oceanisediminis]MBT0587587.1 LacI family DNA-binding transcriptional regulator [Alteromonas oceanisediminis]